MDSDPAPLMQRQPTPTALPWRQRLSKFLRDRHFYGNGLTLLLAGVLGMLAGCGAVGFTILIDLIGEFSLLPVARLAGTHRLALIGVVAVPSIGLIVVSWLTQRFAPEARGHGVPEVITAVARHDGMIRPRVALVKVLASGLCIGTGGSVGREGPIVQIGATLGSIMGQLFRLQARNIKVLVAAGAAAGISATFNAPLAGVVFASEIILGSFAVETLTPIVISSVLADVVQTHIGEHGANAAFRDLHYVFLGDWEQIPSYLTLGLLAGLMAVGFTRLLYRIEDLSLAWFPRWWMRAVVLGVVVGVIGVCYPWQPPVHRGQSAAANQEDGEHAHVFEVPPLFGVGYAVIDHTLHLETEFDDADGKAVVPAEVENAAGSLAGGARRAAHGHAVVLARDQLFWQLLWLLPLAFLKPLTTSLTLGGGGSGGVFAPSLFIGSTLGASFGLICNLWFPDWSAAPGVYAIVGMGAMVAGTTHGLLGAILIVYEMTNDYRIILPIMASAGMASMLARLIDADSIYHKKLSRRGENVARGHEMTRFEHVMVRDVMIRHFPSVKQTDNVADIVNTAQRYAHIESLPVMDDQGKLLGIIRPEDLRRVLDSDMPPQLVNAEDLSLSMPISVSPDENLLEALRDFGTRDIEVLPVEEPTGTGEKRLVGLLMRSDVMRRYRQEMLQEY